MASVVTLPSAPKRYTHNTDGLSGFPAVDIFLTPGTVIGAPEPGVVMSTPSPHMIPWNIGKRVGGWTEYFLGVSGRVYFLTHLASGPAAGTVLKKGEPIGVIAAVPGGAWGPHVHEGIGSASSLMRDLGIARSSIEAQGKAILDRILHGGGGGSSWLDKLGSTAGALPVPGVNLPGPGPGDVYGAGKSVIGGIQSVGEAIAWLFDTGHLLRIGEVMVGVAMVALGIVILARSTMQTEQAQIVTGATSDIAAAASYARQAT